MPPPKTRLNSGSAVGTRSKELELISPRVTGLLADDRTEALVHEAFSGVLDRTSSTKVFHSPQDGHLPSHLGDSTPQFWQKKLVLVLDKLLANRGFQMHTETLVSGCTKHAGGGPDVR